MDKWIMNIRRIWLILLLMMPFATTWAQTLVNSYVIVDGIKYKINSKNEAVAYSLTSDFTGTSVVLADYVEGIWKNGDVEEKVNVPVVNVYDSFLNYNTTVTSLTLPKTFVGEKTNVTYEGGEMRTNYTLYLPYTDQAVGLSEVLVAEGNQNFTSVDGLLCNATGDTLLYIPRQSIMGKEEWRVPGGIRSIPSFAYHYSGLSELGVKKIIFTSDIDYAYLCANDVTLHNVTPPTLVGVDSKTILHVPVGSAPAYYEKYKGNRVFAVLEENTNVKSIHQNDFVVTSAYDINKDGIIDFVGTLSKNESSTNKSFFQFINGNEKVHCDTIDGSLNAYYSDIELRIEQEPIDEKLQYVTNYQIFQQTGANHCASIFNESYSLFVDVDNDGLKDIVSLYNYADELVSIYMQQPDGSYVKTDQYLTEKVEETEIGGGSIVSFLGGFLRNDMFVDDTPVAFQNLTKAVDFNNDGILDLIDDVAGGVMYSYSDGKYLTSKGKEIVYPVDIDGDGVLDYVVFDGETLYLIDNVNSASSEKKELFKNKKIDKVFFKDFDHDGDIDILAFFNTESGNSYVSYFVFLRNNGNGTFRRKESSMADTRYTLVDCRDYDADGKYELLIIDTSTGESWSSKNDGLLIKVENDFTISAISETFGIPQSSSYTYGKNLMLGDFDNDGFTEFYSNKGDVYGVLKSQTTQNTAPKKMAKPTALLDTETNRLKIIWAKGEDKETSACDLTYALRIGTAPGLSDVLRPASLPDGTRRTIREGEMGTALFTLFNAASLKPGKYYIAVQAIDAGGLGGQFSEELEYDHRFIAPKFYVSAYQLSTADTLEVYVKNTIAGATYEWSTSEGKIIEKTDSKAKVLFCQAGIHELNLTISIDGVDYKAMSQNVNVLATKENNSYSYYINPFMDINQDGLIDGYHRDYYKDISMYKNINGSYEEIQLSTFADLNGGIYCATDYNHDGYPDFIIGNCSKGNVFLNYGEQDFDFDYQTKDIKLPSVPVIDLNNDGWLDYIESGLYYAQENLKDYTKTGYEELLGVKDTNPYYFIISPQLFDVNRDGFLDIVWAPNYQEEETVVLCRLKDNTTECSYGEPKVLFRLPNELRPYSERLDNPDPEKYSFVGIGNEFTSSILADFNNDGCLDLAFAIRKYLYKSTRNGADEREDEFALYFLKGKPEGESSEVALKIDGIYRFNKSYEGVYDINNDGCLDIPNIEMNVSYKYDGWSSDYRGDYYTLLMKPDFNYEIMKSESPEGKEVIPMSTKGDICVINGVMSGTYHKTNIQNQSPAAPASVAAKQTNDGMLISWSDAVDKETPAMQMRYNVSVKRKGKKGDGAFIISPMNGLMDEAAIVPGYDYKKSTQMLIPASVLTAGETYEIQVQAIDLWGAHSPMTKAVELTMGSNGYIDMIDRIATNKETTLKYVGTQATSYSLQPGEGGQIVKDNGKGEFVVSWSTEGLKEIVMTVGNTQVKSTIAVQKPYDMTFEVPSLALTGTPIAIKAPADMIALARNVGWRCDKNNVDVKYTSGDEYAYVTFPKTGTYMLEAYCTDSIRGNSYHQQINVTDEMPAATIQRVDTYGNNYFVAWDETALPAYINKVVVLREGNSLNQFVVMDTVSVSQGYYIDSSSNALVVSNRYRIMLLATNGQASEMSDIHKPLHVMLGYSPLGGYNLMWNSYEGLAVDNYQIWRGNNPDNMEFYAQVAGSQQNYTDLSPAEGNNYYSIVFNPQATHRSARRTSPVNDEGVVRSNWVSSDGGTAIVLAQSIEITTGTVTSLTKETPIVNLYCNILPAYSTIGKVSWSIVEGAEFATIDSEGRLTAKEGVGTVTVRATTIDGSNLKTEISIPCNVPGKLLGDVNGDGVVDVSDAVATIDVILQNLSGLLVLSNYDVNADSDVDVMDVTKIVGIILANNSSNAPRRAAMNRLALENVQITVEGDGFLVDVERPEQYTAFQFDIEVPEGLSVTDVMLGDGKTKHNLHFAKKGLNTYTVVGLSLANELLPSIGKGLIDIRLSGTQGGDVNVKNIMFVNPKGEKTYYNNKSVLVGTTGIYGVSTRQIPHSIYDLSGRKLDVDRSQLERGVYIINGKKVIIK